MPGADHLIILPTVHDLKRGQMRCRIGPHCAPADYNMGLESGTACAGLGLCSSAEEVPPLGKTPLQKSVVTETIFDFRQTHFTVHSVSDSLPYVLCKFLEFWQQSFMAFKAYLKVDNDVLLPAVLGLAVVSLTVIALYLLRRRKVAAQAGGSRYVTSLDGSQVRRSTRCNNFLAIECSDYDLKMG